MRKLIKAVSITVLIFIVSGCEKYLDNTALPTNQILADKVFDTDNTISTVVTGILMKTSQNSAFSGSANSDINCVTSLYSDELKALISGNAVDEIYKNKIQNSGFWSDMYSKIFTVNTAIKGITNTKAKLNSKDQWLGECYFLRAFFYFHLVNLYGGVPLALTDDYNVNNKLFRSPESDVYKQIIQDLKLAKSLLTVEYKDGYGVNTKNRFRPNKAVASALLSRVYLYTKDYVNARAEATEVITNANYSLVNLDNVFLANSKETLWAFAAITPRPANGYVIYNAGMPATLTGTQMPNTFNVFQSISNQLSDVFESGDGRLTSWVRVVTKQATQTQPAITYQFPNKYKSAVNNAEYDVIFRLAEQYLIRAEAKAIIQDNTAEDDLNAVRRRAGLLDVHPADLLGSIYKERQTELFTEGGHRFFDLKRTGRLNTVMTAVAPSKSSTWSAFMAYFPIPLQDILQDPNITPNPGYQQ